MEPLRKKKKFNITKLMSIFIAVIMGGSILGVIVYSIGNEETEKELPENAFEYKGYTFAEDRDGLFWAKGIINGREVPVVFKADPRELEDIYINQDAVDKILDARKIYISFDPNQQEIYKVGIAKLQIERIINAYGIPVVGAYSEDADPIDPNVPIIECSESLDLAPVIFLGLGEKTEITSGDCIYIRGETYDDLILAADKLGMYLVGISI
jgi:hypothetical protein